MSRAHYLLLVAMGFLSSGCARVTFYEDAALTKKTGLKYYEAKPYLLVLRKAGGQSDTSVIYLPDKTKPQYAVYSSGLGSHEFSLGIANGILTSYGQKTDSKIPELIQAVTGSLKEAVATAEKAGTFGTSVVTGFPALATEIEDTATTLLAAVDENPMSGAEKAWAKVSFVHAQLIAQSARLRRFSPDGNKAEKIAVGEVVDELKKARDDLGVLIKPLPGDRFDPNSPQARYNAALTSATKRIERVVDVLKVDPPAPPPFDLYEILQDSNGKPQLRKVE